MQPALFVLAAALGVAYAGVLGGEASFQYVNFARTIEAINVLPPATGSVPIDNLGWPLTDCQVVVFDARPTFAWAPPMDDPQALQADYSGIWLVEITGNASLTLNQNAGVTILNQTYDSFENTLTAYVEFAKGTYPKVQNLLVINFADTQANATAPVNTGFKNLKVIHPNYLNRTSQLFTDEWAALHAPFDHMRFMGETGTNSYSWMCGGDDAYACSVIEWEDRVLPTYVKRGGNTLCKGCVGGAPWEHVLMAANELNKDIWINVPVTASSPFVKGTNTSSDPKQTYVYQLALLFRDGNEFTNNVGLKENLNIYIEHSNEVWNFGFKQFSLNAAAAIYEVNQTKGGSNLANNAVPWANCTYDEKGTNNQCWVHRRHARRVYEISKTFAMVFGDSAINKRIRPVYASWTIFPGPYFNDTLTWLENTMKEPVSNYIYALSPTGYYGPDKSWQDQFATLTPEKIAELYGVAAVNNTNMTKTFSALKTAFKLKYATYEAGPGYDVGQFQPGKALSNVILASREPGMKDVIVNAVKLAWSLGVDIFHQFSIAGKCSRYGCWGAQEFFNWDAGWEPKFQGCLEVLGKTAADIAATVAQRTPAHDLSFAHRR